MANYGKTRTEPREKSEGSIGIIPFTGAAVCAKDTPKLPLKLTSISFSFSNIGTTGERRATVLDGQILANFGPLKPPSEGRPGPRRNGFFEPRRSASP